MSKNELFSVGIMIAIFCVLSAILLMAPKAEAGEIGGEISRSMTLDLGNSPWVLTESVKVVGGAKITIEPGTEVFIPDRGGLVVEDGTIIAEGTSSRPIRFSVLDNPDYWKVIGWLYPGIDARLRNCTFEGVRIQMDADAVLSDCSVYLPWATGYTSIGGDVRLERCIVKGADDGFVILDGESIGSIWLIDCIAYECKNGFRIDGAFERINLTNCKVIDSPWFGFVISGYSQSLPITIEGCKAIGCAWGFVISSSNITLRNCLALDCTGSGFGFSRSYVDRSHYLIGCTAQGCPIGLISRSRGNLYITESTFRGNEYSINISDADLLSGHKVWNNKFIGNTYPPLLVFNGEWDNGTVGNYWDNYTGIDGDSDGIGDTPFPVNQANFDRYPLMSVRDLAAPFAIANLPINISQGQKVDFEGILSTDDNVTIPSYEWTLHLHDEDIHLSGDRVTRSIDDTGRVLVELWVTDERGNANHDVTWVLVRDTEAPKIVEDLTPKVAYTGNMLNFSAIITDNSFINNAWVEYEIMDRVFNHRLRPGTSEDVWTLRTRVPVGQRQQIQYRFMAEDYWNHSISSDLFFISVEDDDPPVVVNEISISQASTGELVNASCSAVDNWEVAEVALVYWQGDGFEKWIPLSNSGGDIWTYWITIPLESTEDLHLRFNATDSSYNWALSSVVSLTVQDDEPPTIVDRTRGPFHKGDEGHFQAEVSDNIGVHWVSLETRYTEDADWNEVAMILKDGSYIARIEIEIVDANTLEYRIRADDDTPNLVVTDAAYVDLLGARPHIDMNIVNATNEGSLYQQTLSVVDLDSVQGEHQWFLVTVVPWLYFDSVDQELYGIPGEGDVGTVSIKLRVVDSDGFSDSITYDLVVYGVDFPPELIITDPLDGEKVKKTLSVRGIAEDDDDRISWIRYKIDNGEWEDIPVNLDWSIDISTKGLDVGPHTLEVKCSDGSHESELVELEFIVKKVDVNDGPGFAAALGILALLAISIVMTLRRRV